MSAKFSIRVTNHQGSTVLNMCDADLLGRNVDDKGHVINISKNYYGEKIIHIAEAKNLLRQSSIINMVVLGVITAASFLVWTLPQSATISVSDYGEYLDRAQQINQVVVDGIDNNFQMLTSGELDVDEYVDTAKTSSTQLRSELIQMMQVGVPEQWAQSYQKQVDSTKLSIEYIRETITAAEKIGKGDNADDAIIKAEDVRERADDAAMRVNPVRPDI